jgi:N-acetylglucosaminyldiphosphoundecaprenol N-acetyl-beta-D-mannosaminyltransferase
LTGRWQRNVHCLFGLPFDAVDLDGALSVMRGAVRERQPCFISTPNLNFVVACQTDAAFRDSVIQSDLSLVDGMPLVWVAKLLGIPIPERVAGSTVFEHLRRNEHPKLSVFFFGGMEGVAHAACEQLNSKPSGATCVGYEYPGFGSLDDMSSAATIAKINSSNPDFVVVSLGAKKGQAWIQRNRQCLSAPLVSHLGAVVNFVAGTLKRAPAWMQRAGLEWLWRIAEEPGLWRRYLGDGSAFLRLMLTRALPYAWYLHRHRLRRSDVEETTIILIEDEQGYTVALSGAWVSENLAPLRDCFFSLSTAGKNVCLDMSKASFVDSALLGLVLLFRGDLSQRGHSMRMINLNDDVRRIVRYSCAELLLAPDKG